MSTVITTRDESAAVTWNRYHYTRVVHTAGRIVRTRIERDIHRDESLAVAEVLNEHLTWTRLAEDAPGNWWHTTRPPRHHVDPAATLGPLADRLLRRAAEILAPAPTAPALSPDVLNAVGALLATSYGYNGEHRVTPDDIAWANTRGAALHVIEHADGAVTFTKEHRDECPFITSSGTRDCDDECHHFEHSADARQPFDQ